MMTGQAGIGAQNWNANSIALLPREERLAWLAKLPHGPRAPQRVTDWDFWANDHQKAPAGDWHRWLLLGGRGAGKTRAGAEWLAARVQRGVRCALIGASLHDVREVMIEGPSGLKSTAKRGNRPTYEVSRKRLRWPDGGVAYAYSAEDPDSLRGPQFHYAWADEFCAWRHQAETLAMLRLGLRLGHAPRLCLTTTPKPITALRTLMRSSRYGGDSWDTEPPLCEDYELYRVQVFDGEAVVRTVEVSVPEWVYAERAADFPGGFGSNVRVEVAQKSQVYGYGPVLSVGLG